MRIICGLLLVLAAAAAAALPAFALDLPPLPTAPSPTLPTPTLPTPTLPAPPVPTPTVPAPPVPAPTVPAPVPKPPAPTPAPAPVPQSPSPAPASVSAGPTASVPAAASSRARSSAARPAAHGSAKRVRPVVARFAVRRPLAVRVRVRQLEPVCRTLGSYRLAAHRGKNRLRLPRRVHGQRLGAGVYALVGRTATGRELFTFVTDVRRTGARLLARRIDRDPDCEAAPVGTSVGIESKRLAAGPPSAGPKARRGVFKPPAVEPPDGDGGSPLVRAATFDDAPPALRPLLYALLAVSIGRLAAAAVPNRVLPAGSTAGFVAEKRAWFAAAGIWLLAVVAALTILA